MPGVVSQLRRRPRLTRRRVAMVSMHTSPQDQPGGGDAGGMNVYVAELARRLPELGVEVDLFTRATSSEARPVVPFAPGVTLRHIEAGPFEGLPKGELPGQLCTFLAGVLRAEAAHELGYYDLVHSHYWLSGQVGWVAAERLGIPLVHASHTLAKVKNAALAFGDAPEPRVRVVGEEQVVAAADRLIAATPDEARQLHQMYDADSSRIVTIAPGVDLEVFRPGDATLARRSLGIPPDAVVLTFVGRLQPLKAPDVLLHAAAELVRRDPGLANRLVVLVVGATSGGPSGGGPDTAELPDTATALRALAVTLEIRECVRFLPPQPRAELADVYNASDLVAVPSHNESFGLVALEAAACGVPVVATDVGGLPTAVGPAGLLVPGHARQDWADALLRALAVRAALSRAARPHAEQFSWTSTALATVAAYEQCLTERHARVAGMIGA